MRFTSWGMATERFRMSVTTRAAFISLCAIAPRVAMAIIMSVMIMINALVRDFTEFRFVSIELAPSLE